MRRRTTLLVAGDAGQRLHLATLIGPDLAWRSICGAERWQGGVETGDAWEHLAFDKPLCRRCAGRLEELIRLADMATSVKDMAAERLRIAAIAARGHGSASVSVPVMDVLAALDQTEEQR